MWCSPGPIDERIVGTARPVPYLPIHVLSPLNSITAWSTNYDTNGARSAICNLQFAINTSKPPAPVALEGRLCQSAKPHEYKRSLVWLNLSAHAKLGIPRARVPPLSISILQR